MLSAFSLVELLVVIAIMALLLAAATQAFSNSPNKARQASRDMIRAHLQQARAHAIATGNATAIAIPVLETGGEFGARAISLIEVEKTGAIYRPVTDENGDERLLQRWETLPGNFHFIPSSMIDTSAQTILDSEDILQTNFRNRPISCSFIVFAPNGQIVVPHTAINIAIAQAANREGTLIITERTGGTPVYDFLQVNRLTARTRSIIPE